MSGSPLTTKTIIGIIGEKGSGKDTVANIFTTDHNAIVIGGGDLLSELLTLLHLPTSRENLQKLVATLRKTFGENVIQDALLKNTMQESNEIIVINGLRKPSELKQLQSLGASIIYVTAPLETRLERTNTRQQKADDSAQELAQFKNEEQHSAERDISSLVKSADFTINNNGSLTELQEQVAIIAEKILHHVTI